MYIHVNNATSPVAIARSAGGGSLTLDDASAFGSPSPSSPLRASVFRGDQPVTVLRCVGRSGNALTIDGAADGRVDANILVGDVVVNTLVAEDIDDLAAAIAAAGGGGLAVGGDVAGSTAGGVLYVDAATQLAQAAGFAYNAATATLAVPALNVVSPDKAVTPAKFRQAASQEAPLLQFLSSGGSPLAEIDAAGFGFTDHVRFLLGNGVNLAAGDNPTGHRGVVAFPGKIAKVLVKAETNPGSGGFTLDLKKNGTSVFGATKMVVASNDTAAKVFTPTTAAVATLDLLTLQIVSTGSGVQTVQVDVVLLCANI